jgi:hypothetical protein
MKGRKSSIVQPVYDIKQAAHFVLGQEIDAGCCPALRFVGCIHTAHFTSCERFGEESALLHKARRNILVMSAE